MNPRLMWRKELDARGGLWVEDTWRSRRGRRYSLHAHRVAILSNSARGAVAEKRAEAKPQADLRAGDFWRGGQRRQVGGRGWWWENYGGRGVSGRARGKRRRGGPPYL